MTTASRFFIVIFAFVPRFLGAAVSFVFFSMLTMSCDKQMQDYVNVSALANGSGGAALPKIFPRVQWTLATQATNKSLAATLVVTAQLSNITSQTVILPFALA